MVIDTEDVIRPQPLQEKFLSSPADIALFGGSAFSGKSYALLLECIRYHTVGEFGAVIFRREAKQITSEGGLRDTALGLYGGLADYRAQPSPHFIFPSGYQVSFAHLNQETDVVSWHGSQIGLLCFDELCMFTAYQFWYMLSRNRSTSGIKPYTRMSCLSGNTVVQGSDGRLHRMENSEFDRSARLSCDPRTGHLLAEAPTHFVRRAVESGLRIVTNRSAVTCTHDHRFFRWIPAGLEEAMAHQLRPGDRLAAVRQLPHGVLHHDLDECYLIGYTAGDGCLTGRSHIPRVQWSEEDPAHAALIADVARRVLKVKVGLHQRSHSRGFSIYTTAKSDTVDRWVARNASCIVLSRYRSLPSDVTAGDSESLRSVLQGLFDAEGCVSNESIQFGVVSSVMASQVSLLLRRWGIIARFAIRDMSLSPNVKGNGEFYQLTMGGRQAITFIEQIGFRMERKQQAALRLLAILKQSTTSKVKTREADVVPFHRPAIRHLKPYFGKSWWNHNPTIRRDTIAHITQRAEVDGVDMGLLGQWDLYSWERIKCIEDVELTEAFDVTMPTHHTTLAGCLLSHNCNPDPDSWVADFISWWIDQDTGYPIHQRSGVLRYFLRRVNTVGVFGLQWGSSRAAVLANLGFSRPSAQALADAKVQAAAALADGCPPDDGSEAMRYWMEWTAVKSATFIPGTIYDNAIGMRKDPSYIANLKAQDSVNRARLLDGNWLARATAGSFFPMTTCVIIDARPPGVLRWLRAWDLASTDPNEANPDPDYTVGVLLGRMADEGIVIADVVRFRSSASFVRHRVKATAQGDGHEVIIYLPQDPGQAGDYQIASYREWLTGWSVVSRTITRNKTAMAEPIAALWQNRMVRLVKGAWNTAFIQELDAFPTGRYDDSVDALSGGTAVLPGSAPDYQLFHHR